MRRVLSCALAFATTLVGASPGPRPESGLRGPPPSLGQWVWTHADADLVGEDTTAGIFVGTVFAHEEAVTWRRALSPAVALPPHRTRAIVIRFDDSLHPRWDARHFERDVTAHLEALLAEVGPANEVQLDYDAPVRRLPQWASLVRRWRAEGPLTGRDVWVTSIPAHVSDPAAYRRAFDGAVDGHIMQVFDTGLTCDAARVALLSRRVEEADLVYRVGVGAFERGRHTDHGCWFRRWRDLGRGANFSGLWVFPAGHPYHHLIDA